MRRRLVAAFVGLAAVVVVVFGLTRAPVIVELAEEHQVDLLDRSADAAVTVLARTEREGDPVSVGLLAELAGDGERLEHVSVDGQVTVWPEAAPAVSDDDLSTSRLLTDGGRVTASVPRDEVRDEIVGTLTPLVVMSLLLIALAGGAGWLLARRLAQPFTDLARVAEQFGRGHLDADVPHYAMPEADAIGRAMEDSADEVRRLLRREREVNDHASHDLRTPITALRLTLEDLSLWPDTPPAVAEELVRIVGQVDRFSGAVAHLVDSPVGSALDAGPAELVDVARLLRQAVRDRHGDDRSPIRTDSDAPVLARLQLAAAQRAIHLLVEHAVRRSSGVAVAHVRDGHGYVIVEIEGSVDTPAGGAGGGDTDGVVWDQVSGLAHDMGGRVGSAYGVDRRGTWSLQLPKGHALDGS